MIEENVPTPPPFQVGDYLDEETVVVQAECLAEGFWFYAIGDQGSIWVSPETVAKIPEPWRSAMPYSGIDSDKWIDWNLPKPRGRRKAAQ